MRISIIAALGRNWVIGNKGKLPWRLPADLKRFRELTTGHTVLMGRNTARSLDWKPLKDRLNIVVTEKLQRTDVPPGFVRMPNVTAGIETARLIHETELFIIGGTQTFASAESLVERMYLTIVDGDFEGDTNFPIDFLNNQVWDLKSTEARKADTKNPYNMQFTVWDSKKNKIPED